MDDAGLRPLEFVAGRPQVDYQAHIAHALSLGLPEADIAHRHLHLVANGPSATNARLHGRTMAVNGALQLFKEAGRYPTYWIACDPQELVVDFLNAGLDDSIGSHQTIYLVASKCHPKVFERLKGYDVRLWHVDDEPIENVRKIPVACSVTLCALMLANRMGFRKVDIWGWDLCFSGEEHHATPSQMSSTPERKDLELIQPDGSSQHFETTATWVCELKDAETILHMLTWAGMEISVHGRSMIGALLPAHAAKESARD